MSRGVVILSIFDWWYHSHGHSDMQLARSFAAREPVLFVNSIGMRFPRRGATGSPLRRITRKLRSAARRASRPIPGLDLTVLTPASWPVYQGLFGRLNQAVTRMQIARACARLGFDKPLVIVTLPTFADVALSLDRSALLYNRSDRHAAYRDCDQTLIADKEDLLLRRADGVLYASRSLHLAEAGRAAGTATYIGHGVDAALFTPAGPVADELAAIARPRVGFFGDLRDHSIDFELLEEVARLLPAVQIILGGSQLDDLAPLRALPNVHLFGHCPHEAMPQRWRALDAAILPYRLSPWQLASEPIKLNEILALGLPAVGTPLPAFLDRGIITADSPPAFADALAGIVSSRRPSPNRGATARDWDAITDEIQQIARRHVERREAA